MEKMVKLNNENDGIDGTMGNECIAAAVIATATLSVKLPSSTMTVTVADRRRSAIFIRTTEIILKCSE